MAAGHDMQSTAPSLEDVLQVLEQFLAGRVHMDFLLTSVSEILAHDVTAAHAVQERIDRALRAAELVDANGCSNRQLNNNRGGGGGGGGGGGCTVSHVPVFDPLLPLLMFVAVLGLAGGRRRLSIGGAKCEYPYKCANRVCKMIAGHKHTGG